MTSCNPDPRSTVPEWGADSHAGVAPVASGAALRAWPTYEPKSVKHLELYTPEICAKLRQIAETRDWTSWRQLDNEGHLANRAAIVEEIELTYHLHIAAEASGARAGLPPIGRCPIPVPVNQDPPDPATFLGGYVKRHPEYSKFASKSN